MSIQFFRHWPLFLKGALEANVKRQAAVAQLRTSQTKLQGYGRSLALRGVDPVLRVVSKAGIHIIRVRPGPNVWPYV